MRAAHARLTRPSPRPAPRAPAIRGTSIDSNAHAQLRKCAQVGISQVKSVNGRSTLHGRLGRRLGCERACLSALNLTLLNAVRR